MIRKAALAAYKAGLCILPTATDGSKSPAIKPWGQYKTVRPSAAELKAWRIDRADGFGIVAGAVSGYVELWDFDDAGVAHAFEDAAHKSGLGDVWSRLTTGYLDSTPGGGFRILARYPADATFTDCTLARRRGRDGEPAIKVLIELPTYGICAPSNGKTHPSGGTYRRIGGGFDSIQAYTQAERAALFALARTFDEIPRPQARASTPTNNSSNRPGDDYNQRMAWPAVLEPYGWTYVFDRGGVTYWRRPGKSYGVSATTGFGEHDLLYVFTSSTSFDADKSYSKFGAYAVLEHGGDFAQAASALFKQGYGDDRPADPLDDDPPPSEPATSTTSTSVARSLRLTPAGDIVVQPITWLWDERLPVGVFALTGGREGIGKSLLMHSLAAHVSTGTLPGIYHGTPKGVIMCCHEDSWSHVITPRLMAAGADLTRIYRADIVDGEGFDTPLSLPKDTAALAHAIKDVDAALVVFDPLLSRLDSRLDSHKDSDVRRSLEPLAALADTTKTAIVGLVHVNKSQSTDGLTLLMASRAFTAVARSVLFVAVDPDDDEQRQIFVAKSNLGRTDLPALLFKIRGVLVTTTADGEACWAGKLTWTGQSDRTLQSVLERVGERDDDNEARDEAEAWLVDFLEQSGGTAAKKDVVTAGKQAGHSERTLHRARQHAGILTDGRGFPRQSYWLLPPTSRASSCATSSPSDGTTGDGGTTDAAEVQLCHDSPVVPPIQDVTGDGTTGTTEPTPVVPPESRPRNRGTTGDGGTTEPQPSDESESARRWRESDGRFRKGWQ